MEQIRKVAATALMTGFLAAQGANAAVLNVLDGILLGASGVNVGGTLYDVEFLDGSCASLFDGCNSNADFDFVGLVAGTLASQALLDQVLVDGPLGDFDSSPELVAGCGAPIDMRYCEIFIPIELVVGASSPRFTALGPINRAAGEGADGIYRGQISVTQIQADFPSVPRARAFARFSEAAPVPLPAAGWTLLAGLGALVAARRRKT